MMQFSIGTHQQSCASTFVYVNMVDTCFGSFRGWWKQKLCPFAYLVIDSFSEAAMQATLIYCSWQALSHLVDLLALKHMEEHMLARVRTTVNAVKFVSTTTSAALQWGM